MIEGRPQSASAVVIIAHLAPSQPADRVPVLLASLLAEEVDPTKNLGNQSTKDEPVSSSDEGLV